MSFKPETGPKQEAETKERQEQTFEGVVFSELEKRAVKSPAKEYRSSDPDRKIMILKEGSVRPEPGRPYKVRVVEDTKPEDPTLGKLYVEIVLDPEELERRSIELARDAEEALARNDFDAALEKLRELQRATSPEGVVEGEYHEKLLKEFERQVETITGKEYAEAAGMKPAEYKKMFEPLKERIREIAQREKEMKEGHIPFVIVIKNDVIGGEKAMPLVELEDKKGYTNMSADEIKNFKPIEGVKIPNGKAYLAVDIETGKTSLGKTPDEAIKNIKSEDRSPLTLEEGVALITHHPEILKDHYVWMPGSRHGDGRVASLWLSEGKPLLNWYWAYDSSAGWGSASCGSRVGP